MTRLLRIESCIDCPWCQEYPTFRKGQTEWLCTHGGVPGGTYVLQDADGKGIDIEAEIDEEACPLDKAND